MMPFTVRAVYRLDFDRPPAEFAGRHATLRLEVVSCPRKATLFITRSMANR
jgi:hypothetical protein